MDGVDNHFGAKIVRDPSDDVFPIDPSYTKKHLRISGTSIESEEFDPETATRLLVLYTGGTIGMKVHDGVYSPEPDYLAQQLRKLPIFHDTDYECISSGDSLDPSGAPLVMPLSKQHKRIIYSIHEYDPILDSANMTIDDYARLARDIRTHYDKYDGFVILHGTDTMAYTASALSFMLEFLGKPVILTGSQIPIFETRSDGRDNFLGALIMAGHYCIPEVTIFFHNALLRGNRCTKADAGNFDAFKSLNMSPLAELEINIKVHWKSIYRPQKNKKFRVHTHMCPNVGVLRLFPSITADTVRAFIQPPMQGIVLQTYGAGNGPDSRKDLLQLFREAHERGLIIINITQCHRGIVSTTYQSGKALLDAGIIPGSDMTPEAALMKLSYVLGKDNWDFEKKMKLIGVNLRGEMTVTEEEERAMELSIIEKMAETLKLSSNEEMNTLREAIFPPLMCTAARKGNLSSLIQLKSSGAVFSQGDYDNRTPLHVASCEGHEDMVHYLIENGAIIHSRDRYGHTALDDALRFNQHGVIEQLVAAGAHLVVPPTKLGMMMCNAVIHEGVANIRSWYLAGADINQGDYDDRRALHIAAQRGNEAIVQFILDHGGNPHVQDSFGNTPVMEARRHGHAHVVELLEKAGHRGYWRRRSSGGNDGHDSQIDGRHNSDRSHGHDSGHRDPCRDTHQLKVLFNLQSLEETDSQDSVEVNRIVDGF